MKKSILALALIGVLAFASTGFAATFITIGSGGVGGTYYPLGGAMAEVLTNAGIDIKATSRATSASGRTAASWRQAEPYRHDHGFGPVPGHHQYRGFRARRKTAPADPHEHVPAPAPGHREGSGIASSGHQGQKVSVGAPGGGDQILTNLILKAGNRPR